MKWILRTVLRPSAGVLLGCVMAAVPSELNADEASGAASHAGTSTGAGDGDGFQERPQTLVRLSGEYVGPSDLGDGGSKVSFAQVGLQGQIPFALVGALSGNLGFGVQYRGYDIQDPGTFFGGLDAPVDQVLAARIAPGLFYRLNDRWRLFASGSWLYNGAVGSSVSEATLWGGLAGVFYQVSDSFTLVGGFGFSERFDQSNLYIPVLGFRWQIDDRWNLVAGDVATTINGPTLGTQLTYRLDKQWRVFGIGGFEGTFTRLSDDSSIPDGSLRYRSAAALVGAEYEFVPGWAARVYAGARIAQQYTFRDADGTDVTSDTTGTSPTAGFVLRASF
jgi:long-subunit fatty acid transport protein